jgi:hypothetical protein
MEYAQDLNMGVILYEIGDSVMSIKKNADGSTGGAIALTDVRKFAKDLGSIVNTLDGL